MGGGGREVWSYDGNRSWWRKFDGVGCGGGRPVE